MVTICKCHVYDSRMPWLRFANAMVTLREWHVYNPQVMMFWLAKMLCEESKNVKPKTVIRPFYELFYNCLQSFGFYKLSFACF